MTKWFKSKTMWTAFVFGFLGLIQTTLETAPIPEAYTGVVAMVFGLLMAGLRIVTTTTIGAADG